MQLRPYQQKAVEEIHAAWNAGAQNALFVLPTGGGKTVIISEIIKLHHGNSCAIAHRQELVGQISLALNHNEIPHRIFSPRNVITNIVSQHMRDAGKSFYRPNAKTAVAGIDTLVSRQALLISWLKTVSLWLMDEAHHVQADNKWGQGISLFSNARGLGMTATPIRGDGKGLGRSSHGVFDKLIQGPYGRQLIEEGYLCDYIVYQPDSKLSIADVPISKKTGDLVNGVKLKTAIRKSTIIGDVPAHYAKYAMGKLGITFAANVEDANTIAENFNKMNIPAAALSAKNSDQERVQTIEKFRNRHLFNLVNVDLFSEGFDLPAIEVVSFASPTESFSRFSQRLGRGLRIMQGKDKAIIIDHVGDVVKFANRLGLPDANIYWSLDPREIRNKSKPNKYKKCPACTAVYTRIELCCPECGHEPIPVVRSGPEYVDGDLTLLDPALLAKMRGQIEEIDRPVEEYRAELQEKYCPPMGVGAHCKRHLARQDAQKRLRESIAWWAGYERARGIPDAKSYRKFYIRFGVDVLTAQTLNQKDALELSKKVIKDMYDG